MVLFCLVQYIQLLNKHKYTFNLFDSYAKMIKKARILGGVCDENRMAGMVDSI